MSFLCTAVSDPMSVRSFCRRPGRENSIALPSLRRWRRVSPSPDNTAGSSPTELSIHSTSRQAERRLEETLHTLLIFIYYILAVQGIIARSCTHQEICFRAVSPHKVGTFCNHIWFLKKNSLRAWFNANAHWDGIWNKVDLHRTLHLNVCKIL